MVKDDEVRVSILCITYNHENYIRETIEGFLMQKTSFRFEVLIHEDASTDNTAKIIREYEKKYPYIFRVIYESENQYDKGIEYCHDLLAPMARGKYIALCEGDDAWIDDKKLQMQVDYMEAHPECSMSAHKAYLQYPADWKGKRDSRAMGYSKEGVVKFNDLFNSWNIATSSFVFRKDLYMLMPEFFRKAPTGDEPLKFYMAGQGNIFYFDRVMSVYNKMSPGSWSLNFENEDYEKQKEYCTGYISFFEQLNKYFENKYADLFAWCIKERIRRLLLYILIIYNNREKAIEKLNDLKNACDLKWKIYIENKKSVFDVLDTDILNRVLKENVHDKEVFVYGAGTLAERNIVQIKKCGYRISNIIISDNQAYKEELCQCKVIYFSDFLKQNKKNYIIIVAVGNEFAHEIINCLKDSGITEYLWLYRNICEVD